MVEGREREPVVRVQLVVGNVYRRCAGEVAIMRGKKELVYRRQ